MCKALESIPSTERNEKGGGAGRDERRKGGCINGRYPKSCTFFVMGKMSVGDGEGPVPSIATRGQAEPS